MGDLTEPGREDYREGNRLFEAGLMDEAVAAYDRAVTADANNASYRYNRSLGRMLQDRLNHALEDAHVALELEPQSADIRFLLGEIRSRMGERALALANFKEALVRDPAFEPARVALQRLTSESEDGQRRLGARVRPRSDSAEPNAHDRLPDPLEIPTIAEIVRASSDEGHVVAIEHTLHALPREPDKRVVLKRAVLLSALHRRDAGACWEQAISFYGRRSELVERAIRAYFEVGEWDEILRLRDSGESLPSQEVARMCAHALQAEARPAEAIQLLERVSSPTSQTLETLAGIHLAAGDRSAAQQAAQRAAAMPGRGLHTLTLAAIADQSWFSVHRPLDDLAGLEDVKNQIRERVVLPLLVPELYAGGPTSNKFLMMGPPGCGKTTIARVAAREAHAQLKTVHLTSVLNLFTGNSEANLTGLFSEAKDAAREGPVVMLIDEVDSIAIRRDAMVQAGEHRLVTHFMDELDQARGFPRLMILATTNVPFDIDSAVLRSGRLGSPIYVGPPGADARRVLLEYQLNRVAHAEMDLDALVRDLESYSPADIEQAFTTIAFARNARKLSGTALPLTESEVREVFDGITPSVLNWIRQVRDRIASDPSLEGFVTEDLRRDLDDFQSKVRQTASEKEAKSSMFR